MAVIYGTKNGATKNGNVGNDTRYKQMTPAMKIGLTSSHLSWRYLLVVPIQKNG